MSDELATVGEVADKIRAHLDAKQGDIVVADSDNPSGLIEAS